jgi:hypothetical protein
MKVKIFRDFTRIVEEKTNDFIKDKEIIDIKYQINRTECAVLIMYK